MTSKKDEIIEVVSPDNEKVRVTQRAFDVVYAGRGYQLEDAEMAKYSKAAERGVNVENSTENYASYSEAELKKVKNDDLKAYLDAQNIEYASDAVKDDLIGEILRK